MQTGSKSLVIVGFCMIALVAIILLNSNRSGTQDALNTLESKFIDTTVQEQENLVNRFDENDIEDIQASIKKYEEEILPAIEDEIEIIRQNIITTNSGSVRDAYKVQLIDKLKERKQYRDALIGYQQLETWYYENKGGVLGNNFEDVQVISSEAEIE